MVSQMMVVSLGEGQDTALRLIRFRRPDKVLLAVPTHLKQREKDFRQQLPPQECVAIEVSPYDFNFNRSRLRQAVRSTAASQVEFCVSAGPLAVRTAALQLAREKGCQATHATLGDALRIHDALRPQAPPVVAHNTLECYLESRDVKIGSCYPLVTEPYDRLAEYLVSHRNVWGDVITPLRVAPDGKDAPTGHRSLSLAASRLQPPHQDLLRQLEENEIISQVARAGGQRTFHISETNWNYLNGHWLEVFVLQRLADLFDDCSCGQHLTTPHGVREADFIGLRDGRFTLISCKTSAQSYDPAHLRELQSLSRQLGEADCLRFYVTDRFQHNSQPGPEYEDFVTLARSEAIHVIFGDHLANIRETVRRHIDQR